MMNSKDMKINTALAVLVIGTMMISLVSAGTPTPPANFDGPLHIDGSPAPAGTEVRAFVGTLDVTENNTIPVAHVTTIAGEYGSGLGNLEADCQNDDVLTFMVGSRQANEQTICSRGTYTYLPLSVGTGGPQCSEGETQSCYTGPPATEGVGECSAGTQSCVDLYWGTCEGQILPATETCNGLDDDCDGSTDEGLLTTYYQDSDGDSYGDAAFSQDACQAPEGFVEDNTDCEDSLPSVNPGASEVCDSGYDDDCDGFTDCLDSECAEAQVCQPEPKCIEITNLRVLNAGMQEVTEIEPGAMYNIEVTNYNDCDEPLESLQIIQISEDSTPVNIGSVMSTIDAYSESTVTAGFILPNDTASGTTFDVDAYNWNAWMQLDPGSWEPLSEPDSTSFLAMVPSA